MPKAILKKSTVRGPQSTASGFTLIELLVVISIISILASLLLANFVGIRQRARDGQRKSDLRQIQGALELYRADNGAYPTPASGITLVTCNSAFSNGTTVYMSKVPCDPLSSTGYNSANYGYSSAGTTYNLCACLENANDPDINTTNGTLGCTSTKFICYTNP